MKLDTKKMGFTIFFCLMLMVIGFSYHGFGQRNLREYKGKTLFLLIIFIVGIIYLLSEFLVKKEKLNKISVWRFWNVVLLISFIITGLSGVYLVFYTNLLVKKVHIIFGALATVIGCAHIWKHRKYYVKI